MTKSDRIQLLTRLHEQYPPLKPTSTPSPKK